MTPGDVRSQFETLRANVLVPLAARLEAYVRNCVISCKRVDRVSARAKDVERFVAKAAKVREDGQLKYTDPLHQIQDQVGARIVVYYLEDVEAVSRCVEEYLRPIERQMIVPDSEKEFGYFGKHYIMLMPTDVYDDETATIGVAPRFFELQIKTLFQHAWSEAEHDLGYKPGTPLNADQKRKMAFTAAQAWGADHIFNELFGALDAVNEG